MVSINFEAGPGSNEKVGGGHYYSGAKGLISWSLDHDQPIGSSLEEPIYNLLCSLQEITFFHFGASK